MQPWRWRHHVQPKHWYLPTKLHTSQPTRPKSSRLINFSLSMK
jgi:hypothetical protein